MYVALEFNLENLAYCLDWVLCDTAGNMCHSKHFTPS